MQFDPTSTKAHGKSLIEIIPGLRPRLIKIFYLFKYFIYLNSLAKYLSTA